ncbi:hypothetical protein EVAR_96552_1 [Eumeta japonica]|uniref:Uncharacterized protein n=1 Tax=Eumeta variegata TaxID=151549 RepID=A0A4C1WGG8_EUMVA|nr:hypothetical protein EVAR_96552_1 [Eumeta japonica]
MASATAEIEAATVTFDEKEYEKGLKELESVKNDRELDEKLNSMSKVGFSLAAWMKYIFNRDTAVKEFNPVWLSVQNYRTRDASRSYGQTAAPGTIQGLVRGARDSPGGSHSG